MMSLLVPRLVLLLLLGLAVTDVIADNLLGINIPIGLGNDDESQEGQDVEKVASKVSKVAIKLKPTANTPVSNHVDTRRSQEVRDTTVPPSSKREDQNDEPTYITTDIKGLGRAIDDYIKKRSQIDRKRSFDNRTILWDYKIPIVFHSSYPDPFFQNMVVRVLRFISTRTCLTLTDVTSSWDSSDPQWFFNNGYKCNCYIKIMTKSGCNTSGKGGVNGSLIEESPCQNTDIIVHETFHAVGVPHEQQTYFSTRHMSVFYSAISKSLLYTYDASSPNVQTTTFDASTTELYKKGTWSDIGDSTYIFIRPDQGEADQSTSSENVILYEINNRYQCSAKFCANKQIDCSPGYLAYLDKANCKCVCPPEFDPETNCKEFVSGADKTRKWQIPVSFFSADTNACLDGFQPTGWIKFCGNYASGQGASPVPIPTSGKETYFPICSKTSPTSNVDWNAHPFGGQYCIIKPSGVNCGGVFTEASFTFQSACEPEHNGSIGDVQIDGNKIIMKFCCLYYDRAAMETVLPNQLPFRLLVLNTCPNVLGMRVYKHTLTLFTTVSSTTGTPGKPTIWLYGSSAVMNMCYFLLPEYGCNQKVTLSASKKKVTITTKGYPGPRPANTRCIYCFDGPAGSQIRVTFNDYDLEVDDKFRFKRYHQWAPPSRLSNDNPWKQFVTESNYLCMEFWSSYKTNVTNRGANFTVDVILPSDSCYDTSQNGMDYVGTTNVSETYEPCLTWKETADCDDSPVNAQDALTGYFENNYCRNPGGKLLQPWCYFYKNGTSCGKRYCDVCNTKAPVDWLKTSVCAAYISQDPKFCQNNFIRYLCFKSCGMAQAPAGSSGTCSSPPPVPSDGSLVGKAQSSYQAGDRAYVQCTKTLQSDSSTKLILCTRNGWKGPVSACGDCPPNYTLYGDRCIYFTTSLATRPEALAFCNSLGRNGTLMYARNQTDADLMSSIRNKTASYYDHTWLGIYLCDPSTPTWCFLGTSTPITYSNWNGGTTPNNAKYDVAYMYRETSTSGRNIKYVALSSNDTSTYTYFCQIDRTYPPVIADKYSTCQDVLDDFPTFCKGQDTMVDAASVCAKSCGLSSATPKCSQPSSSTYTRVSGSGSITTGDYMEFQCNAGYFLTGGDTSRACGLSGSLLGTAPVCTKTVTSIDVGLSQVREREDTLAHYKAFVLDLDQFRVPISGKITAWYYYCNNPGRIYFLVFRKSGSSYNIIGNNTVTCIAEFRMSLIVPSANQTSVMVGDIVGAWSPDEYALSISDCSSAATKISNLPTATAQTDTALMTTTSYGTIQCLIPAIGYRVEK